MRQCRVRAPVSGDGRWEYGGRLQDVLEAATQHHWTAECLWREAVVFVTAYKLQEGDKVPFIEEMLPERYFQSPFYQQCYLVYTALRDFQAQLYRPHSCPSTSTTVSHNTADSSDSAAEPASTGTDTPAATPHQHDDGGGASAPSSLSEWVVAFDKRYGQAYVFNTHTGQSQWTTQGPLLDLTDGINLEGGLDT
ncbi:unnamed protein product [Vitrella brassicaformis CCMP3155]|uniref:WW domain-containing protein n=2 Tax=Vitrella brassicaformis TaxID=1169539 RepID=A0A0G4ENZ1_VITBC|nr:unnamed protein product [Vitrella brassicaformis CCMP3155]|eukprot:CEL99166.1 unnamed protein product [Vitrella brassicaformis CCMP3155]